MEEKKIKNTLPEVPEEKVSEPAQDILQPEEFAAVTDAKKKEREISQYCEGEKCHCGKPSVQKIKQVIFDDMNQMQHGLTQYVCQEHFDRALRPYLFKSQPRSELKGVSEKEVEEMEKVKIYSEIIRDLKILRDNIGKPLAPKEISEEDAEKESEVYSLLKMPHQFTITDNIYNESEAAELIKSAWMDCFKWYRDQLKSKP